MYAIVRRIRSVDRPKRLGMLLALAFVAFCAVCLQPKIPLGARYHVFADQRTMVGIPRALNVLSNAIFLIVGVWGLKFLSASRSRSAFLEKKERLPYVLFFTGVAFTGIGSAYYHLAPVDSRLPWDLLPMTLCFMSILAATTAERISVRAGLYLLPALITFGMASVLFWQFGELRGQGDYRFYLFAQYFPAIAIAAMIILFQPRYTLTRDLFVGFVFYVLAKIVELLDAQIYGLDRIVSGHALKHLCAGVACYWVLRMLMLRRATELPQLSSNAPEYASYGNSS